MRPVLWFRIAAGLVLLFAIGHTIGFLTFQPPSLEGQNVWKAMNTVRFSAGSSTFSYGDFYTGFGLFITAFQLFAAWLAWSLGSMARRGATGVPAIAWGMSALQLISLALSLRYFSAGPAVLSGLTAACLIVAAISISSDSNADQIATNRLSTIDA
jgi:hypothetical protein